VCEGRLWVERALMRDKSRRNESEKGTKASQREGRERRERREGRQRRERREGRVSFFFGGKPPQF
jgi:hypothetical protein